MLQRMLVLAFILAISFGTAGKAATGEWEQVAALTSQARQLDIGGKYEESAAVLTKALKLRKTLPAFPPGDTKGLLDPISNEGASMMLDAQTVTCVKTLRHLKKVPEAITLLKWHMADTAHLSFANKTTDQLLMAESSSLMGKASESEKYLQEAFATLEESKKSSNKSDFALAVQRMHSHAGFLKRQGENAQATAFIARVAPYAAAAGAAPIK